MMYSTLISSSVLFSIVAAAPTTSATAASITNTWHSLSPNGSVPTGASTDFSGSFGISIKTIRNDTSSTVAPESAQLNGTSIATPAAQVSDGQIQHQSTLAATATATATGPATPAAQVSDGQIQQQPTAAAASAVAQISDGQIQHQTTAAPATASAVAQISDGQIQHQTASAIAQISDGQIQHQTAAAPAIASAVAQISDGQIQHQTAAAPATASAVAQISDGQIQHQTAAAPATASAVAQISDGQIQHQTTAAPATASAVDQISDGQVQHQTKTTSPTPSTASAASQITDGQIQNRAASPIQYCAAPNTLTMTLSDSELRDSHGRVGAIVSNHQFQFDGPPPQAGTIYASGWSIYEGVLALGSNTKFYQCQSGDFYNLYDEPLGDYCEPVQLEVLEFVDC